MTSPDPWTTDDDTSYDTPEPWASRLFGSRTLIRTVAWVAIAAMFLVPFLLSVLSALSGPSD